MTETHEAESRGGFPPMRTWQEPTVRSPGGGAEYGDMIAALGCDPDEVKQTTDRHWTWTTRKKAL